jgi:IS1 family transposase
MLVDDEEIQVQAADLLPSYEIERNNLTIRTFLRRFTRLALRFSKMLANLRVTVCL